MKKLFANNTQDYVEHLSGYVHKEHSQVVYSDKLLEKNYKRNSLETLSARPLGESMFFFYTKKYNNKTL